MKNKNAFPEWVKFIYPLVLLFVGWKLWQLYKAGKDTGNAIVADIKGSSQVIGVKDAINQNGIVDVRVQAVEDAAEDIYNAFYKDSLWGFGEDEEKAIQAFNSLKSISEAKATASIYKANYKKVLYTDLKRLLGFTDFPKLKTSFVNAIKA